MNIIWFRQDLRIHDHAALWHASQHGPMLALVILSPQQWLLHHDAAVKIDLYVRQLHDLKQSLVQLNIPLLILNIPLWQDIPRQLSSLCHTLQVQQIFANIEMGVNELKRDAEVQQCLNQQHIEFTLFQDRTLFPLNSIRNQSGKPYQVFGAFKKTCYERLNIGLPQCYPLPSAQQPIQLPADLNTAIPRIESLIDVNTNELNQIKAYWPETEIYALSVLDDFIDHKVSDYQKERDFPFLNSTSQLSTYLNLGIVSIRQCLNALFRAQHGQFMIDNSGQQTWLDELLWREFYQHILFDFPHVSKHLPFKANTQRIVWRDSPEDLNAWQQGRTGIPIVDAGMRQLLATGWMHNRVRMIVAMFLTKNLLIDWRLGEQWFMQHLADGDLAANNGGWQWCASTGTDAVPYFRVFNPVSQSQKFDSNGDYIRQWLPELAHLDAKSIHEPYAKQQNMELDYPQPIVDLKSSRIRAIEAFKGL